MNHEREMSPHSIDDKQTATAEWNDAENDVLETTKHDHADQGGSLTYAESDVNPETDVDTDDDMDEEDADLDEEDVDEEDLDEEDLDDEELDTDEDLDEDVADEDDLTEDDDTEDAEPGQA